MVKGQFQYKAVIWVISFAVILLGSILIYKAPSVSEAIFETIGLGNKCVETGKSLEQYKIDVAKLDGASLTAYKEYSLCFPDERLSNEVMTNLFKKIISEKNNADILYLYEEVRTKYDVKVSEAEEKVIDEAISSELERIFKENENLFDDLPVEDISANTNVELASTPAPTPVPVAVPTSTSSPSPAPVASPHPVPTPAPSPTPTVSVIASEPCTSTTLPKNLNSGNSYLNEELNYLLISDQDFKTEILGKTVGHYYVYTKSDIGNKPRLSEFYYLVKKEAGAIYGYNYNILRWNFNTDCTYTQFDCNGWWPGKSMSEGDLENTFAETLKKCSS